MQNDKAAYDLFQYEARRNNMEWVPPVKEFQSSFYHSYFKDQIEPEQFNMYRTVRNDNIMKSSRMNSKEKYEMRHEMQNTSENFIPLSNLLKRNHNDRVQYHLKNLEMGSAIERSSTAD